MNDTLRLGPGNPRTGRPRTSAGPLPPAKPAFSEGEVLAGRYRVIAFVARGGMGEVYEAEDLVLNERVALKSLRRELSMNAEMKERFRREISLSRQVTHPNVCRVLELGVHQLQNPPREIAFLTMEFLRGETLESFLRRKRKLTVEETLPIVTQVAEALAAAHRVGVVHRDLKSANVMLEKGLEGEGSLRAVVTDFGLAYRQEGGSGASVTVPGMVVGTPDYMAPERAEGAEATPLSDLYSLGVLMYEMVAGIKPHIGASPMATLMKRIKDPPSSPRLHTPDLDPKWEAAILGCLAIDPKARIQTAREVIAILSPSPAAPAPMPQTRHRFVGALVGAAGLLLAFPMVLWVAHRGPGPFGGKAYRKSVAIIGFKNLSTRPEVDWLSTALSEMLSAELGGGQKLRIIPGENVARMKTELSLANADSYGKETLGRIRSNLGADLVVVGSYLALGNSTDGQLRLDVRLQDPVQGDTVATLTEVGTEAHLLDLIASSGTRLRQMLGAGELTTAEARGVRASLPANPEAARLYAEGLSKLRLSDALAAQKLLEEAVSKDPRFPLAFSALADAWSTLGYDVRAKKAAARAFELSEGLSKEDRLSVEARYRQVSSDQDKAVQLYRELFAAFPDHLDYGLLLAEAQILAGRGNEAAATVRGLRELPGPAAEDPRIDLTDAKAAFSISDYTRARASALKAVERGKALGARLLVARARLVEGDSLYNRGESNEAERAWADARKIFEEAGDREGVARALGNVARAVWSLGDLARARSLYEECLAVRRETGNAQGIALATQGIGNVLAEQGDLVGARKSFEKALLTFRELGDKNQEAASLINIGGLMTDQGNFTEAGRTLYEALALKRESGDKRGQARALNRVAEVLFAQGDIAGALTRYREALALSDEIGQKGLEAVLRTGLGGVLMATGDLAGARGTLEKALTEGRDLGHKVGMNETRLVLVQLLLEEGRASEAEHEAREALDLFRTERISHRELAALELVARSLLTQGKIAEARDVIDPAMSRARKSELFSLRLAFLTTQAQIEAAAGRRQVAHDGLERIRTEAAKAGALGLELQTRLLLAKLERASGPSAASMARLQALSREAREKGFGLIAKKTEAAN